jgi:hypothetical protein
VVALFNLEGDSGSVVENLTVADSDNHTFLWLFLGGVGNDDSAFDALLLFDPLEQDSIVKRSDFHRAISFRLLALEQDDTRSELLALSDDECQY